MIRKVIAFVPRWQGAIEGHAVNSIKSFFPKLCADYEFDDLLQEAYIVFMKCKKRYAGVVDKPSWFMCLFSSSLRNRLINMCVSCKHTYSLDDVSLDDEPATTLDVGYLSVVFSELPVQVRRLAHDMCFGDVVSSKTAAKALRRRYSV